VRIVDEAGGHVGPVLIERVRPGRTADPGGPFAQEVGPDRFAVTAEMAGDGRDGPPPFEQCICFHVFSH
jgi:hypothetical protein